MRVFVTKMRENGIKLSRSRLADSTRPPAEGELSLRETTDEQLHRMAATARLDCGVYSYYLLDARILWIEGNRFALTGFERRKTEQGEAEFAQSWVVELALRAT